MPTTEALIPPFPHFDPFGTEFREPGRISHPNYFRLPIADCQFEALRAFFNWQLELEIGNYKDPSNFRRSS